MRVIRPVREYHPVWLGLVSAGAIVLLVLGSLAVGTLGLGDDRYQAEFAHTAGIRDGDEVRVAGIVVGEVTGTRLDGEQVLVSFRTRTSVRLGRDTTATVKVATLLGGRYVELRPAGAGSLPGDRITLEHTTVPFDLRRVIETGGPAVERIDGAKLRESLKVLADDFRGTPDAMARTLDGLGRLSEIVRNREDQIGRLLTSAKAVTSSLNENRVQLFALMGQADALVGQLLHRRELIRGVLAEFGTLTGLLRDVLDENRPQLEPLLANLAGVTGILDRNDEAVDRALELLAPAGRYLTNAFGNGPYGDMYLPYAIVPDNLLCAAGAIKDCR